MKKHFLILLILCFVSLLAAGCTKSEAAQNSGTQPLPRENPTVSGDTKIENTEPRESSPADGAVDVDLTAMSATMVYAEVFNIMTAPDDYIGKTIKMSGPYSASYYNQTDQYYHYVLIEDAASCCQQGIEFVWNGEHAYPDEYPEVQSRIEVVGVFDSYDELGQTYYYLAVDDISISN